MSAAIRDFLPAGKRAAICFTIDDVHPSGARPEDPYEAGGACERGMLGDLAWLLERHPQFQATLFTTADWRGG